MSATPYDFSFRNPKLPYMARGDFMLGGMAVVVSPLIEPEHYADAIKPIWPHPLIKWIWRLFNWPILPEWINGGKLTREQAFQIGDKLFVSPAGWAELEAMTAAPQETKP